MFDLLREVRQATRAMRQAPGFTVVVVLTLAIGIGANTAIFSVVDAVLLRPFPFAEPDRLAVAWAIMPDDEPMFYSPPDFVDVRERNRSFERLSAYAPGAYLLATDDETVRLDGARVTADLFGTLGVAPALGRVTGPGDDEAGAAPVALISDRLWRGRFGSDAGVIGRTIIVDGAATEIVGVMPPSFGFPPPIDLEGNTIPVRTDIWMPFAEDMRAISRGAHFMTVIGRLRADASVESAGADLRSIAADLAATFPESNADWSARVVSMNDVVLGDVRPALLALLAAVAVVLLIACVNVANLMLARATGRQKEFAIRAALGANRPRLLRQAVIESQLLALAGAAAGLALAWIGTRALVRIAPANIPRLDEAGINGAAVLYAIAISVLTGLFFGLVPALRAFAPDLSRWLREGARTGGSGSSQARLRDGLVVAEFALSLLLLVGAGLLFRSFITLRGIDPGFRAENGITARISLPPSYGSGGARAAAFQAIEDRVLALPGVEAAGLSLDVPLASDFQGTEMEIEGAPPPGAGRRLANFTLITPGYFDAMAIPITAGRGFGEQDVAGAEPTVVINAAAAERYFPGENPIGRRIIYDAPRRIVGIAGDVRLESLTADAFPTMYFPYYQVPGSRSLSIVVRTRGDLLAVIDGVRGSLRAVDSGIPLHDVRRLQQILSESLAAPRFSSTMLVLFSVTALLLAAVGIYGVISYATAMRTREIGVRIALGARPSDAMRLVIGHALRLAALGAAAGIAASLLLTRYLQSLLFGVGTLDPLVLSLTTSTLILVAILAGGVPAWRAARTDPLGALRYD